MLKSLQLEIINNSYIFMSPPLINWLGHIVLPMSEFRNKTVLQLLTLFFAML